MKLLLKKEVIGNNPSVIRIVINEMMNRIEAWNHLDECEYYEFRLVLNELISNGIFHGNKGYCNKKVTVAVQEVDPSTLDIYIKDEGKGFDYKRLFSNPSKCEGFSFSEGGRGLRLVQAVCDHVQFNENGNEIKVRKSIRKKSSIGKL